MSNFLRTGDKARAKKTTGAVINVPMVDHMNTNLRTMKDMDLALQNKFLEQGVLIRASAKGGFHLFDSKTTVYAIGQEDLPSLLRGELEGVEPGPVYYKKEIVEGEEALVKWDDKAKWRKEDRSYTVFMPDEAFPWYKHPRVGVFVANAEGMIVGIIGKLSDYKREEYSLAGNSLYAGTAAVKWFMEHKEEIWGLLTGILVAFYAADVSKSSVTKRFQEKGLLIDCPEWLRMLFKKLGRGINPTSDDFAALWEEDLWMQYRLNPASAFALLLAFLREDPDMFFALMPKGILEILKRVNAAPWDDATMRLIPATAIWRLSAYLEANNRRPGTPDAPWYQGDKAVSGASAQKYRALVLMCKVHTESIVATIPKDATSEEAMERITALFSDQEPRPLALPAFDAPNKKLNEEAAAEGVFEEEEEGEDEDDDDDSGPIRGLFD
jgi:hypothetical protein